MVKVFERIEKRLEKNASRCKDKEARVCFESDQRQHSSRIGDPIYPLEYFYGRSELPVTPVNRTGSRPFHGEGKQAQNGKWVIQRLRKRRKSGKLAATV